MTQSEPKVALVAIVKNEGPYLMEWLCYHLMLGVDHIYLYDDGSTDNSGDIYEKVYKTGKLTVHRAIKTGIKHRRQEDCYHEWRMQYGHLYQWAMPWDADEFLWLREGVNLKTLLASLPDSVGQVRLNWKVFGSTGLKFADPSKFVIERFTKHALPDFKRCRITKLFVRLAAIDHSMCAHCSYLKPDFRTLGGDLVSEVKSAGSLTDNVIYGMAACFHYSVKSVEEFVTIKMSRGYSSDKPEPGKIDSGYFRNDDRNDLEDTSMRRHISPLKEFIKTVENITFS